MHRRIFLDTNILIDLYDPKRPSHRDSTEAVMHLLEQEETEMFTSCDILTTMYYLRARDDKRQALEDIEHVNSFCTIIEFANAEVTQSCQLMRSNPAFDDLEDTIQYVMARKIEVDLILSNDAGFASEEIEVMTTEVYVKRFVKGKE